MALLNSYFRILMDCTLIIRQNYILFSNNIDRKQLGCNNLAHLDSIIVSLAFYPEQGILI